MPLTKILKTSRKVRRREALVRGQTDGESREEQVPEPGTHNLEFDSLPVQLDGSYFEVHADGADITLCVRVILCLKKKKKRKGKGREGKRVSIVCSNILQG